MKTRILTFFILLAIASGTALASITYELNGGVTNDYGWLNKNDMFQACMADCGVTGLSTLDELQVAGDASFGTICNKLTDVSGMLSNSKWDWLEAYIMSVQNADAAATALVEGTTSAGWRYALAAFFLESKRASWPVSADFSGAGQVEAFVPAWKHAFANPTEPTEEFVLNAPFKEGYTFAGWCANADLTGAKVKTVNAESTGTLYAKWIDYVATVAEVKAMADDTETQVSGVVTFINGKNVYVQDATGGILLYMAAEPTFAVGQKVIVKGTKALLGGAPEVKGCVEVEVDDATMPAPITFEGLANLVNDSTFKYFAQLVKIPGLTITEYDSYNNPTFSDGTNSAKGYKMVLDPVAYPIGFKVTLTAIAAWYNGFEFVGDVAGVELAIAGVKEDYAYPTRHDKYTLTNNWVISVMEDNYAANKPGSTGFVRGMAAKDGIMYFINRETASITRVDGATGNMLEPIKITGEHLFEVEQEDGTFASGVTLPFNDIKFDNAGNCLIGGCITGPTQYFMVYKVDLSTGATTLIVNDRLADNPAYADITYRFDSFGVAGDVTKNGVIMAADGSGSWNVYRWLITDGVAGEGEQIAILLDPATDQSLCINAAGFGTTPQIAPQDEYGSIFYVDGYNTLPMLFEESGTLLDDFIKVPTGTTVQNNEGETTTLHTGLNGLQEFQVGNEYFLVMAATMTNSNPPSAFALYKFADEARTFDGLEPLWYFPHNGLGSAVNGWRTAVPSVEVNGNTATVSIYAVDNGYASYTFTVDAQPNPNTITYELNGGVTNDYGWMSKSDMFEACMTDALGYDLGMTLDEFKQSAIPFDDLFAYFNEDSHCQNILDNARWDWLEEYLMMVQEKDQLAATLSAGVASHDWRYAIAAFFFESQYDTSLDYTDAGKDEAYIPYWKHGYDNPTQTTREFTLNAPYKENHIFEGWYATPDFSSAVVTTINASTSGTLYAKWRREAIGIEMVGVVKRALQYYDATIVLTHEADGTAHIYNVIDGVATEISQEGVIARDPENAGDLLAISDIALTEDGKLVAVNYMVCQSSDDYVDEGYKRGENRFYIWNDLAEAPSVWFMSKMNSNFFRSKQGYTMAVKGTSANAEILVTGIHATKAWARVSSYRVIDGVYSEPDGNHNDHYFFYDVADAVALETTVGTQYELTASPLGTMNWILDAELIDPVEIVEPETNNTEISSCVALSQDLGKKYQGVSIVTVGKQHLMVVPYANAEGLLAGIKILDITDGLATAIEVSVLDLDAPVEATAATAVAVNERGLTITIVADNNIYTLENELCKIYAEETITACDSYEWNGQTYTQSGDYTYTTVAANGCDSIVTLHLTINQSEVAPVERVTICYGETYTWNSQTYSTEGEYSVTLSAANGCDSIATLHLTILPEAITKTEAVTVRSDELPYKWHEQDCTTTGRYTNIEKYTTADCDSIIHILDLTVLTTGAVDEKTITICDSEAPYQWYGKSYNQTGKYTFTEKYVGTDIDSIQHILNLTINSTVYVEETITACDSYEWNGQTYTQSGDYTYTTVAANDCDSIVTLHLTINQSIVAPIENATICYGETYTWNGQTYSTEGEYSITFSNVNGCDSIATLHLTVLPEVQASEESVTICYGEQYEWNGKTYTTTGEYSMTLSDVNGCDSIPVLHLTVMPQPMTKIQSVTISNDQIPYVWNDNEYTETGQYTVPEKYTNIDCDSVLHVLDLTVLTTDNYDEENVTICDSELPFQWHGQSYTQSGKYSYAEKYVGTTIDSIQHILNLSVVPTHNINEYISICHGETYSWNNQIYSTGGEYSITLSNIYGCDSIVTLHLTVLPEVIPSEESATICYGETYTWNGQTYSTEGEYSITLSNTNGCDSVATLHLTVLPEVQSSEESVTTCYGETYEWNGQIYTATGTYSINLSNINGCDSIVTLHLTILPEAIIMEESASINEEHLPYLWRGQQCYDSGTYNDSEPFTNYPYCDSVIYVLNLTVDRSNKCGEHLYWQYSNNTLSITGSGAMYDNPDLLTYRKEGAFFPYRVRHVILPDGMTHIGNVAFADCANLTNIDIPSSVTSIGDGAFSWTGLQSVTIPASVTNLGEQVFETCNNLHTILYEGTPSSISNQTVHPFIGCVHLDTIITPAALWHCTTADPMLEARYGVPHKARYIEVTNGELTKQAMKYIANNGGSVEVLDLSAATNTTLPLGALLNNYRLSTLYLPEQIEVIPEMLAEGCHSLLEILIPATVTEIGNYAFAGCTNVWRMTVEAVLPPKVYDKTFDGIDRSISLIVPAGSEELYRQAEYWKEFFIENTNNQSPKSNCQKILHEDHILILREGKVYTTMGQLVK